MFFNKKWDNCGCHSGIGKDGKIGKHGERFGIKTIKLTHLDIVLINLPRWYNNVMG